MCIFSSRLPSNFQNLSSSVRSSLFSSPALENKSAPTPNHGVSSSLPALRRFQVEPELTTRPQPECDVANKKKVELIKWSVRVSTPYNQNSLFILVFVGCSLMWNGLQRVHHRMSLLTRISGLSALTVFTDLTAWY